jgi:hypothetical protein
MSEAEISLGSIVCRSGAVVATEVNGEVVLMILERDRCHGLGETGSAIWHRLHKPIAVAELVSQLEAEFDAPPDVIESDVLLALNQFASEGLIQIIHSGVAIHTRNVDQ